MTPRIIWTLSVAAVLAMGSSTSRAVAAQDIDLMAKWTAATIVRYQVVAEFSGSARVVKLADIGGGVQAPVTDRFEVDLQWNQSELALVGKPVVRNFPSTRGALPTGGCPRTATGPFEHATVLAVVDDAALKYANAVRAEVRRDLQAGSLTGPNEVGPCGAMYSGPASTETIQLPLPIPHGMMLAMPSGQSPYTHNGKAFSIKGGSTADVGWTFTVTPTIVK